MMKKSLFACIALVALVLSGCMKSDNPSPSTPKAYLSIFHMAPTAPPLDVYFNNSKVSNAPFTPGSLTSGYNAIEPGTFSIKFKKNSSDSLVTEVMLAQYDSLAFYTLFIYNEQANGAVKTVRIKDDFTGLDNTKPYYRFFHGSPNTGPVDLYIDNVLIENDRSQADFAGGGPLQKFTATSPGGHTIEVKLAGTDDVLASVTSELMQGNAYTIYLKGLDGSTDNNKLMLGVLRAN